MPDVRRTGLSRVGRGAGAMVLVVVALTSAWFAWLHHPSPRGEAGTRRPSVGRAPHLNALGRLPDLSVSERREIASLGYRAEVTRFGLKVGAAVKVNEGPSGQSIFLVPGVGFVCLMGRDIGAGCADQGALSGRHIDMHLVPCALAPGRSIVLFGVVANDVSSLEFQTGSTSDHRVSRVPVKHNSFVSLQTLREGLPSSVTWRASGVLHRQSLSFDPQAVSTSCAPAPEHH